MKPAGGAESYEVTRNPCDVCSPLGAAIAFAGVERGMTLLHGSQGCATYIRRYVISHFREPLDVASSSFTEETAVFGGASRLRAALANVVSQYAPEMVGVATTCLAETIGEDAASVRRSLSLAPAAGDAKDAAPRKPLIVAVSTPSYRGTHRDGFRAALRALTEATNPRDAAARLDAKAQRQAPAPSRSEHDLVAIFPSMISPADIRGLKVDFAAFGLEGVFATDYSDTLDGGPWKEHRLLPEGGTSIADLARMRQAASSIELGKDLPAALSAAAYLEEEHGVPRRSLSLPVGVAATDAFIDTLAEISGRAVPRGLEAERERLLDSYADAHKYVFGARALLYGDPDFVDAMAAFLREIGMVPVLAKGEGRDFHQAEAAAVEAANAHAPIDLVLGNGKGYKTAVKLKVPIVRVGFPIHDRFGAQRTRILGYAGTQELFDRIVNALIERRQDENGIGYTYY